MSDDREPWSRPIDPTCHDLAKRESPVSITEGVGRPALIGMLALDWAALDDLTTDVGSSWFLEGLWSP